MGCYSRAGLRLPTFYEFKVVADFSDNPKGGEHHAVGAPQARAWATIWLVPLATLQANPTQQQAVTEP